MRGNYEFARLFQHADAKGRGVKVEQGGWYDDLNSEWFNDYTSPATSHANETRHSGLRLISPIPGLDDERLHFQSTRIRDRREHQGIHGHRHSS